MTNEKYSIKKGFLKASCIVPADLLNHGKFTIQKLFVLKGIGNILYEHTNVLVFEITGDVNYSHGKVGKIDGLLKPKLEWQVTTEVGSESINLN